MRLARRPDEQDVLLRERRVGVPGRIGDLIEVGAVAGYQDREHVGAGRIEQHLVGIQDLLATGAEDVPGVGDATGEDDALGSGACERTQHEDADSQRHADRSPGHRTRACHRASGPPRLWRMPGHADRRVYRRLRSTPGDAFETPSPSEVVSP